MDKDSILSAALAVAEQLEDDDFSSSKIFPQPVPTTVRLTPNKNVNGDRFAVLDFVTPVGENTFFLDLDSADKLADSLKKVVDILRES